MAGIPAFRRIHGETRNPERDRPLTDAEASATGGQRKRNGGGSHRPPRTIPSERRQAGRSRRLAHSLALNSIWNLRGSLTEAVYGTPTAADRLLRPLT